MRNEMSCPVCANTTGHISKDGGETWSCDMCLAVHDGEVRVA
jgi:ribosomal protein L37AE/L43A